MSGPTRAARAAVSAVVAASVLLAGCWHQAALEQRGIVPVLGVDLASGGGYEVTAEVIFPPELPAPGVGGGGQSGDGTPVFMRSVTAPTVMEAVDRLAAEVYLLLDFTHLEEVVVSQAAARAGLGPLLDFIAQSPQISETGWLLVAQGSAAAVLRATRRDLPKPNEILSQTVHWSRINTPYTAQRLFTAFDETPLVGSEFETAGLTVDQSTVSQATPVVLSGEALFRGARLVGWLRGAAALGYAAFMERLANQSLTLSAAGDTVGLQLMGARRRISVLARGSAVPLVRVSLNITARLVAASGAHVDFWRSPQLLQTLQAAGAAVLRADVEAALRQAQGAGSDAFGVGQWVRVDDPAYWRRARATWDTAGFRALPVAVRVRMAIRGVGEILCSVTTGC